VPQREDLAQGGFPDIFDGRDHGTRRCSFDYINTSFARMQRGLNGHKKGGALPIIRLPAAMLIIFVNPSALCNNEAG
ncbi:MAG: hypothetical protein ABIJ57_11870, partial [Pseudomonadota bacterium]